MQTESGIPVSELAALLRSETPRTEPESFSSEGVVPWSWRAATLAGLISSCLIAGFTVLDSQSPAAHPNLLAMLGLGGAGGGPMLIITSILGGGQAGTVLILAHFVLKPLRLTHAAAYALAGGLVGVAWSQVDLGDGVNPWLPSLLAGLSAGFFYRIFAGTRSR